MIILDTQIGKVNVLLEKDSAAAAHSFQWVALPFDEQVITWGAFTLTLGRQTRVRSFCRPLKILTISLAILLLGAVTATAIGTNSPWGYINPPIGPH